MHFMLKKTMLLAEMVTQFEADSMAEALERMPPVDASDLIESIKVRGWRWDDGDCILLDGATVVDGVRRIKAALSVGIPMLPCRCGR